MESGNKGELGMALADSPRLRSGGRRYWAQRLMVESSLSVTATRPKARVDIIIEDRKGRGKRCTRYAKRIMQRRRDKDI
jgi:hypothetical protein